MHITTASVGVMSIRADERRTSMFVILVSTMTASSFQIFALAVLAADIIDDLGISRTGLGLLGSLNTAVGALSSPAIGRITDRIGPRRAVVIVLALSGLGMGIMALSTTIAVLSVSAVVSGIPQGWGNPATNALIAEQVPEGARGTVTGIKQSGVQLGIFIAGLTLPTLSLLLGWRGAMWGFSALFAAGAVAVGLHLGHHRHRAPSPIEQATTGPDSTGPATDPSAGHGDGHGDGDGDGYPTDGSAIDHSQLGLPRFVWLLALYSFSAGTAGGAIGRFFPLWAHEEVGLSTVVAGILVGLSGLIGIVARIIAGRAAERWITPRRLLSLLALVGAAYCLALAVTTTVGAWILWPAAILSAVGISAWNAVAMLATISAVPRHAAGRASGIVMFGFLGGLTVGSPVAGWAIDRWDSYQPVWASALALTLFSAAVMVRPRAAQHHSEATSSPE